MAIENGDADDADAFVWGDIVDSSDECDVEDESEPVERYREGLYYPVYLGEVLVDRYLIEHKLGHGGFSTVWMAHDTLSDCDVALKILTPGVSADREFAAQKMIADVVQDTSRLLIYQDTFLLPGNAPNVHHRVLVFPLLGPSLYKYASRMPVAARMSSAKQLLQAIKALHDGGVVHRDINIANVLYGLTPFEKKTSTATKYESLGRPRKMSLLPHDPLWKHGELVMPMAPKNTVVQGTTVLADFGMAIKSGTSVEYKFQSPPVYCAPERFHNVNPSFASDMWSYMCIFGELCIGFRLFYGWNYSSVAEFVVASLGALPSSWKDSYQGGGEFNESWYSQDQGPHPDQSLEAKVKRSRYDMSPVEQQLVLSILQRGLSYAPEHRFSAGELLEDASFKELMAIHGV